MLRQIGVPDDALILVAGSTHDGEEILLAGIARRLRVKFPKLFLDPGSASFRGTFSAGDIGQKLKAREVKFIFRSEIFSSSGLPPDDLDCLLVNSTGELKYFYEPAAVVFIGKSLTAVGGQNPVEPGAQGKAIVFGPNMQNFTDITRAFLQKNAAVQVNNAEELERRPRRTACGCAAPRRPGPRRPGSRRGKPRGLSSGRWR